MAEQENTTPDPLEEASTPPQRKATPKLNRSKPPKTLRKPSRLSSRTP